MNRSIRAQLSVVLSVAIALLALVTGAFSFISAYDEAHEIQDSMLRHTAALLLQQGHAPTAPTLPQTEGDMEDNLWVALWDQTSAGETQALGPVKLNTHAPDGLQNVGSGAQALRVMLTTDIDGHRLAVGQQLGFRNHIARDSALRTVAPLLAMLPLLVWVITNLVRRLLDPVATVAQQLASRRHDDLSPIDTQDLPSEIRPFADATNDMMQRVDETLAAQRRFVADAAHELRTPMTALSLQAEQLAKVPMPEVAQSRLQALRLGIDRGRQLLNQLLDLAKSQNSAKSLAALPASPQVAEPASVLAVFRQVLELTLPLADAKSIDLGVLTSEDVTVSMPATELTMVIKNLVDNAIRYTPAGGQVDLSVQAHGGSATIEVTDNGPGIAADLREQVFEPFFRVLGTEQQGSGLGLSIVQTLVQQWGGQVKLSDAHNAQGLRVQVVLPVHSCSVQSAPE